MADAETALAGQAEAIAQLLDPPRLTALLNDPGGESTLKACPSLSVAHAIASERGHRTITTRHAIAATALAFHRTLVGLGKPGIEEVVSRAMDLLDPIAARRDREETKVAYAPRLIGALARAVATGRESLHAPFVLACYAGDEAVASLRAPIDAATVEAKALMKQAGTSETG
jgi:hypothetical protein